MAISVFELFSIGIGPSSSHTMGPLRAARQFITELESQLEAIDRVKIDLYGSLALTGQGHATDIAVMAGLEGEIPAQIDPDQLQQRIREIRETKLLRLLKKKGIFFDESAHILFHKTKQLPYHPNGMRFTAYDSTGREKAQKIFYSIGGGFIIDHELVSQEEKVIQHTHRVPYPFQTAQDILNHCHKHGLTVQQLVMENEKSWRSEADIRSGLLEIWHAMERCIERGCEQEGILPGGLNVRRRAKKIKDQLLQEEKSGSKKLSTDLLEWVSLWALAVNEENAAGSRVVTAPTNGSAGVIPAVLKYYVERTENPTEEGIVIFLLVAGAIGILYKIGASISAAEMGCMGEVGVACSMAAAGLTAALGGTVQQIENAAEIGMEHNLGLTCDPIKGLVQIPCIERNTMGAIKAINAMLLALRGDGIHHVSLDQVIATMRQTGHDMKAIYKETSLGGLAVNVPEC